MHGASCERVREGLTEYLEAALPPGDGDAFEAHLAGCAACRKHLQEIRWTIDHLGALPSRPMPSGLRATLMQALHSRQSA